MKMKATDWSLLYSIISTDERVSHRILASKWDFSNPLSPPETFGIESCLTVLSQVGPSDPVSCVCDCCASKAVIAAIREQEKPVMYCCLHKAGQ